MGEEARRSRAWSATNMSCRIWAATRTSGRSSATRRCCRNCSVRQGHGRHRAGKLQAL